MRAAVVLCAVSLLVGCQTGLPNGWTASNPDAWGSVSAAASEHVYGSGASTANPVPMLAACGRVGALEYQTVMRAGSGKQVASREAVRAMRAYCETLSPPVDYAGLTAAIRSVCQVTANDTDQCLGLMVAGLKAPPPK